MGRPRRQWRRGQGPQLHAHHNARACVSAEGYSENSGTAGSRFLCSWLLGRYVMAVGCSPRFRASAKRCSSCCHCFLYDSHALMLVFRHACAQLSWMQSLAMTARLLVHSGRMGSTCCSSMLRCRYRSCRPMSLCKSPTRVYVNMCLCAQPGALHRTTVTLTLSKSF